MPDRIAGVFSVQKKHAKNVSLMMDVFDMQVTPLMQFYVLLWGMFSDENASKKVYRHILFTPLNAGVLRGVIGP